MHQFAEIAKKLPLVTMLLWPVLLAGCQEETVIVQPVETADADAVQVTFNAEDGKMGQQPISLNDALAVKDKLVVVDFWATWCGPRVMMAPALEEVARTRSEDVILVKVDVDKNSAASAHYQISSIPDVRVFRNGQAVGGFLGFRPAAAIAEKLNEIQSAEK